MRELFFRSLSPGSQLVFLLFLCFSFFLVFSLLGSWLLHHLYGFQVMEDPLLLQSYDQPYVISANKILLLCQHLGLFIVPALVFNALFSPRSGDSFLFSGSRVSYLNLLLVLLLMFFSFPLINFLLELNARLELPAALSELERQIRTMEEDFGELTKRLVNTDDVAHLIVNILIIGIIPALGEEFIFRGIVQKLLARMTGRIHLSIWIAAALFSALHFQFYGFLPRLLLGVVFGYLAVWGGSVWYAVAAHLINNAGSILIAYLITTGEITPSAENAGNDDLLLLIPGLFALMAILWYFKKRSRFEDHRLAYLGTPLKGDHNNML